MKNKPPIPFDPIDPNKRFGHLAGRPQQPGAMGLPASMPPIQSIGAPNINMPPLGHEFVKCLECGSIDFFPAPLARATIEKDLEPDQTSRIGIIVQSPGTAPVLMCMKCGKALDLKEIVEKKKKDKKKPDKNNG